MGHIGNSPETAELKRLADVLEASAKEAAQTTQLATTAALAAKQSALWTMIAAVVSLIGILLATATTLGWLDWAKKEVINSNQIASQRQVMDKGE
jgi:hypothetical protein